MITLDGDIIEEQVEEVTATKSINPFDFVKAITHTKESLIVDEWSERQYRPYIINKSLSFGMDTVIAANEMNQRQHLDNAMQFSFLINIIRPRKRFNQWLKATKIEDLDVVKQYYKYNSEKAQQALRILTTEQINTIKERLFTGGLKNGTRLDQYQY